MTEEEAMVFLQWVGPIYLRSDVTILKKVSIGWGSGTCEYPYLISVSTQKLKAYCAHLDVSISPLMLSVQGRLGQQYHRPRVILT